MLLLHRSLVILVWLLMALVHLFALLTLHLLLRLQGSSHAIVGLTVLIGQVANVLGRAWGPHVRITLQRERA
jgi:hypothetical protein